MKITKRQLRRIIKEEKAKILAEQKVRRIVRRRLLEAASTGGRNPGFDAWKKLPEPAYKAPERDGIMNADPYWGNRELPDSHSKGHVSIDRENNVALDGNDTKMTPDEVIKKFGGGYSLRGAIEEEVTMHVLQALLDAGYHTRHTPDRSSRPIEDEVAFLRDRVIPFLKKGASWPKASKLLNKLSKNPNDSKTLKSLEDMIGTTNPGFTRDEALDALANIAFSSDDKKAAAVDSAIDAVRDVFDS